LAPHEGEVVFETARLRARLPGHRDVAAVLAYYRDNLEHLRPWSPRWPPDLLTPQFWRDQVVRRQAESAAGIAYATFLFQREDDRRVIGNLSLTQIVRGAAEYCALGYGLAADAQGHGYMVEAVRGAVGFAFRELGLHRVHASYIPYNRRSGMVLRRAGFRVEGYARDYLRIDGRWEDHVMTSAINDDWDPNPTPA
jgi:ribosomal-protein-alanine N-acetyltransferase